MDRKEKKRLIKESYEKLLDELKEKQIQHILGEYHFIDEEKRLRLLLSILRKEHGNL